jgi:two-component system, LytTR family, sensor kinase
LLKPGPAKDVAIATAAMKAARAASGTTRDEFCMSTLHLSGLPMNSYPGAMPIRDASIDANGWERRFVRLWLIAFGTATIIGLSFAFQQVLQLGPRRPSFLVSLATQLIPWYSWALLTPLIVEVTLRLPVRPLKSVLFSHGVLVASLLAVHILLISWPTRALGYFGDLTMVESWTRLLVVRGASEVLSVGLIIAVIHAVRHAGRARARELEHTELARQMLEARLDSLRTQLEPHFLLNTLNSISALAASGDRESTESAITVTGDLLREALRRPDLVSVEQELNYLGLYLRIIELSRADAGMIRISADPGVERCSVPSFVLQPLVENALRHGCRADAENVPVEILITRERNRLELRVRNRVPHAHPPPSEWLSGIGMRNTSRRLETLYGSAASMSVVAEGQWVEVVICIPVIEAEWSAREEPLIAALIG